MCWVVISEERALVGTNWFYLEITNPMLSLLTFPVRKLYPQQPFGWELSKGPPPPYLGCRWMVWPRLSPSIIPFGYLLYEDFSWGGGDQAWEWCSRSKLVFYLYPNPSADPCLHPFPVVQEARAGVFPVCSRLLIQGPLTLQTPPPLHTIPSPYD